MGESEGPGTGKNCKKCKIAQNGENFQQGETYRKYEKCEKCEKRVKRQKKDTEIEKNATIMKNVNIASIAEKSEKYCENGVPL